MKKIFFVSLIIFLFFPFIIFSAESNYQVTDSKCNKVFSVKYEGMVPCGRCLEVTAGTAEAWSTNECGATVSVVPPAVCGAAIAKKFIPCTMCHFFIMLNYFSNFIMFTIVPPIMVLIFSIGGVAFYQGGQSPQKSSFAKKILTSATIGFVLIYGSWFIINLILTAVGVADWTGLGSWFQIACDVVIK